MKVTRRTARLLGLVAFVLLGAIGLYAHIRAAPDCDSDQAQRTTYQVLRDEFHFDSVFMNDVRTVSGGYFSDRRECAAQVTEIRGNVNASDMPWHQLRYWIARNDNAARADITVKVGGAMRLAAPPLPLWQRLLAWLVP